MKIRIVVNGRSRDVAAETTVAELVATLAEKPALLAVERNRSIVPKADHASTRLSEGDEIEIVTFVGGG